MPNDKRDKAVLCVSSYVASSGRSGLGDERAISFAILKMHI